MKKFSIATHLTESGPVAPAKVEGVTIEGTTFFVEEGVLFIVAEQGGARSVVATFARGAWLHIFDVASSK